MRAILVGVLMISVVLCLSGEDPKLVKQDGKESAKVQKLILQQRVNQAEIDLILAKYVVVHNCPTGRAGLNTTGQIMCETPPPFQGQPLPPPGTN